MRSVLRLIVATATLAAAAATPAVAQTSARAAAPIAPAQCQRPAAPRLPNEGVAVSQSQLDLVRQSTLDYFRRADTYRLCLDGYIERLRDEMFRTNASEPPELTSAGYAHQAVSQEKANVYEAFTLMCLGWEDRNRRSYPAGCILPANPGA
jgi:hypothetical protein